MDWNIWLSIREIERRHCCEGVFEDRRSQWFGGLKTNSCRPQPIKHAVAPNETDEGVLCASGLNVLSGNNDARFDTMLSFGDKRYVQSPGKEINIR